MNMEILNEPWGSNSEGQLYDTGLCPVVFSNQNCKLKVTGHHSFLPLRGSYSSPNECNDHYLYDLPLSGIVHHSLTIMGAHSEQLQLDFSWASPIRNPIRNKSMLVEDDKEEDREVTDNLLSFINSTIGLFDELRLSAEFVAGRKIPLSEGFDILSPEPDNFKNGVFDLLPLDWNSTCKLILKDSQEPRYHLILRIAMDLGEELRFLSRNPRKVLRRERKKTPLSRVQQLDSACLAWLVRQPGQSAVEKAGPSQQIYSIVREEFFNTLENQVLKKFTKLCVWHAQKYLDQYSNYESSDRFKLVKRFLFGCKEALNEPVYEKVSDLKYIPQPNYVLQFDPTYSKIWKLYLALMHREKEIEQTWEWQGRLWADVVRLFVSVSLQNLAYTEEIEFKRHYRDSLYVRNITNYGKRLSKHCWPRGVELNFAKKGKVIVDCFDLNDLHDAPLPSEIKQVSISSGADYLVYFTPTGGAIAHSLLLCVWGIHVTDNQWESDRSRDQTRRAAQALLALKKQFSFQGVLRGFLLQSNSNGISEDIPTGRNGGVHVEGLSLSNNSDEWRGALVSNASQYIAECALTCLEEAETYS
jgi:hypothetical protein